MKREPLLKLYDDGLAREDGRFVPGVSYSPATQFKPGERTSIETEIKAA